MEPQFDFPTNGNGQVYGIRDSGIEEFKDDALINGTREPIQNSIDAPDPNATGPVEVRFSRHMVPSSIFPGRTSLLNSLNGCLERWGHIKKDKKIIEKMISVLEQNEIPFLKISDYNTTGLLGVEDELNGKWFQLVKSVGVSDKGTGSGGSFGIGKHAPFASSSLHTVFYSTKNTEGASAFQGVAKLASHNYRNYVTQGTGYFGVPGENKPLVNNDMKFIDDFFNRKKIGTDIFIAGFKFENWKEEIIKAVLDNFFYAIYTNKLVVYVEDILIDSATMEDLINKHFAANKKNYLPYYFQSLKQEKWIKGNIPGFETGLKLSLIEGKGLPNRIAMIRKTGMKIFDKDRFQSIARFAGVFVAYGEDINELLRQTENPEHNRWNSKRFEENEKEAERVLKAIYAWINKEVKNLGSIENIESLEIEGVSQFLPDDNDINTQEEKEIEIEAVTLTSKNVNVNNIDNKNKVKAKKRNQQKTKKNTAISEEELPTDEFNDFENDFGPASQDNNKGQKEKYPSEKDPREEDPRGRDPKDKVQKEKPVSSNKNEERPINEPQSNEKSKSEEEREELTLDDFRSVVADGRVGRIYNIYFTPTADGVGHLDLSIVGDDGNEKFNIKSAYHESQKQELIINTESIGPIVFEKGIRTCVKVELKEPIICALGVEVYED
ncbi:hypothetical protein [Neobacillus vireti]|uniref:hypothetical protein n=1 Tax=Neobacillus vireti TaxID=220686 RepID=UPI002FFEDDF7